MFDWAASSFCFRLLRDTPPVVPNLTPSVQSTSDHSLRCISDLFPVTLHCWGGVCHDFFRRVEMRGLWSRLSDARNKSVYRTKTCLSRQRRLGRERMYVPLTATFPFCQRYEEETLFFYFTAATLRLRPSSSSVSALKIVVACVCAKGRALKHVPFCVIDPNPDRLSESSL